MSTINTRYLHMFIFVIRKLMKLYIVFFCYLVHISLELTILFKLLVIIVVLDSLRQFFTWTHISQIQVYLL